MNAAAAPASTPTTSTKFKYSAERSRRHPLSLPPSIISRRHNVLPSAHLSCCSQGLCALLPLPLAFLRSRRSLCPPSENQTLNEQE